MAHAIRLKQDSIAKNVQTQGTKSLVGTLISKLHCPPLHCGVMRPRVLLPLQRRFYEAGQISRNLIYNLPVRAERPRGSRFSQQHGSPGILPRAGEQCLKKSIITRIRDPKPEFECFSLKKRWEA